MSISSRLVSSRHSPSREWVNKIWNAAAKRVEIRCDEYHAHTADCIVGKTDKDKDAVIICQLCEALTNVHNAISKLVKVSEGKL